MFGDIFYAYHLAVCGGYNGLSILGNFSPRITEEPDDKNGNKRQKCPREECPVGEGDHRKSPQGYNEGKPLQDNRTVTILTTFHLWPLLRKCP